MIFIYKVPPWLNFELFEGRNCQIYIRILHGKQRAWHSEFSKGWANTWMNGPENLTNSGNLE